jgi:hypothetical protein
MKITSICQSNFVRMTHSREGAIDLRTQAQITTQGLVASQAAPTCVTVANRLACAQWLWLVRRRKWIKGP